MTLLVLALLIGVVAGLRTMIPFAALSWAAYAGWLDLSDSWLAFLGYRFTPYILSLLAVGELVIDQLPSTPSRKVPMQFGARIVVGAASGAIIGGTSGSWLAGLIAGFVGAVIGTLGGSAARSWLARGFGSDRPGAVIEDIVAIGGAYLIMASLR